MVTSNLPASQPDFKPSYLATSVQQRTKMKTTPEEDDNGGQQDSHVMGIKHSTVNTCTIGTRAQ
jgi:hypothetical protein